MKRGAGPQVVPFEFGQKGLLTHLLSPYLNLIGPKNRPSLARSYPKNRPSLALSYPKNLASVRDSLGLLWFFFRSFSVMKGRQVEVNRARDQEGGSQAKNEK